MKKLISILGITVTLSVSAQPNHLAKMAPVYAQGYYVSLRDDTIHGDIQTNPVDETEFFKQFSFRSEGKGKKPRIIAGQKAKAYGFDNRHFVMVSLDNNKKLFVERLVSGRIRQYEIKYHGKKDGYPAIKSIYYIKNIGAEGPNADLKSIKKIPQSYYKKALKPYIKDQPMIWSDLDKYNFDPKVVGAAIKKFNKTIRQ